MKTKYFIWIFVFLLIFTIGSTNIFSLDGPTTITNTTTQNGFTLSTDRVYYDCTFIKEIGTDGELIKKKCPPLYISIKSLDGKQYELNITSIFPKNVNIINASVLKNGKWESLTLEDISDETKTKKKINKEKVKDDLYLVNFEPITPENGKFDIQLQTEKGDVLLDPIYTTADMTIEFKGDIPKEEVIYKDGIISIDTKSQLPEAKITLSRKTKGGVVADKGLMYRPDSLSKWTKAIPYAKNDIIYNNIKINSDSYIFNVEHFSEYEVNLTELYDLETCLITINNTIGDTCVITESGNYAINSSWYNISTPYCANMDMYDTCSAIRLENSSIYIDLNWTNFVCSNLTGDKGCERLIWGKNYPVAHNHLEYNITLRNLNGSDFGYAFSIGNFNGQRETDDIWIEDLIGSVYSDNTINMTIINATNFTLIKGMVTGGGRMVNLSIINSTGLFSFQPNWFTYGAGYFSNINLTGSSDFIGANSIFNNLTSDGYLYGIQGGNNNEIYNSSLNYIYIGASAYIYNVTLRRTDGMCFDAGDSGALLYSDIQCNATYGVSAAMKFANYMNITGNKINVTNSSLIFEITDDNNIINNTFYYSISNEYLANEFWTLNQSWYGSLSPFRYSGTDYDACVKILNAAGGQEGPITHDDFPLVDPDGTKNYEVWLITDNIGALGCGVGVKATLYVDSNINVLGFTDCTTLIPGAGVGTCDYSSESVPNNLFDAQGDGLSYTNNYAAIAATGATVIAGYTNPPTLNYVNTTYYTNLSGYVQNIFPITIHSENNITGNTFYDTEGANPFASIYVNGITNNFWYNNFYEGGVNDSSASSSGCFYDGTKYIGNYYRDGITFFATGECGLINDTFIDEGFTYGMGNQLNITWSNQSSYNSSLFYFVNLESSIGDNVSIAKVRDDNASWLVPYPTGENFRISYTPFNGFTNGTRRYSENFTIDNYTITECRTLSIPNKDYTLGFHLNCTGTAINITANNVSVNCAGYTVNYSISAFGAGFNVSNANYTTIKNCNITKYNTRTNSPGIYTLNSYYNLFENNTYFTGDSFANYMRYGGFSIINNSLMNTTGGNAGGLDAKYLTNINFTNNKLILQGNDGILSQQNFNHSLIYNNHFVIRGASATGINLYFGGDVNITKNNVSLWINTGTSGGESDVLYLEKMYNTIIDQNNLTVLNDEVEDGLENYISVGTNFTNNNVVCAGTCNGISYGTYATIIGNNFTSFKMGFGLNQIGGFNNVINNSIIYYCGGFNACQTGENRVMYGIAGNIENNYMFVNGTTCYGIYQDSLFGVENTTIKNNYLNLTGTQCEGMTLYRNLTVINNTLYINRSNNLPMKISLLGRWNIITNNTFNITSDTSSAITLESQVKNNTFTGNTFYSNNISTYAFNIDTRAWNNTLWYNNFYAGGLNGTLQNTTGCFNGTGNFYNFRINYTAMAAGECGLFNATFPSTINLGDTINIPWSGQSSYNKTLNYTIELITLGTRTKLYTGYLIPGYTTINTALFSSYIPQTGNYEFNIVANDGVVNSTNRNITLSLNILATAGSGAGTGGNIRCSNESQVWNGTSCTIRPVTIPTEIVTLDLGKSFLEKNAISILLIIIGIILIITYYRKNEILTVLGGVLILVGLTGNYIGLNEKVMPYIEKAKDRLEFIHFDRLMDKFKEMIDWVKGLIFK